MEKKAAKTMGLIVTAKKTVKIDSGMFKQF